MLALAFDPVFARHDPGRGHPERAERLEAVLIGLEAGTGADHAPLRLDSRAAGRAELERVHEAELLDRVEALCRAGGGSIDADTAVSAESWEAAVVAAGSGLAACEVLEQQEGRAAFLVLRPPGHHATSSRAMGFCLINNVAVAAAERVSRGERVLVIDWDAHHGNGTQEIFYRSPDVLYVSLHEWPLYPGTGDLNETGAGPGAGATVNFPLPAGATGDVYREALETVVAPLASRFGPDWVFVSAGYDAHRADPLTGLGLSAGDFADLTAIVAGLAPGRTVLFLEGGYDLAALRDSVTATVSTLVGRPQPVEPATAGGPGRTVVEAVRERFGL